MKMRRAIVDVGSTDFTDVSAVVVAAHDLNNGVVTRLRATGFDVPLFVVADPDENVDLDVHGVTGVLASDDQRADFFGDMVETAASRYDDEVLPPFFGALAGATNARATRRSIVPGIRAASSSCGIPPAVASWTSSVTTSSGPTSATRM